VIQNKEPGNVCRPFTLQRSIYRMKYNEQVRVSFDNKCRAQARDHILVANYEVSAGAMRLLRIYRFRGARVKWPDTVLANPEPIFPLRAVVTLSPPSGLGSRNSRSLAR
jgi:hypothetical protein